MLSRASGQSVFETVYVFLAIAVNVTWIQRNLISNNKVRALDFYKWYMIIPYRSSMSAACARRR